jgi:uncharacterized iron-regulated membrane protein
MNIPVGNSQAKTTSRKPEIPSPPKSRFLNYFYQSIWRWHFYAGIIFAPFLLILAFSGAVYLFKPQIEGYLYKDMLTVREVGDTKMTIDEIIAKTTRAYTGTNITSVTFPEDPQMSVKLAANRGEVASTLYADPYTGNILGILNNDQTFAAFFKKMHSQLVIGGTWANRLVELAACWALILVVTGLYLWWPRNKFAIWGTILPRFSKPGSRQFWRDLHAVPAFWLSLLIIILIASGLPWSGVLGVQIDRLANATNTNYPPYALSFQDKPESVTVTKDIAHDVPWATENLPVPASAEGGYVRLDVQDIMSIADKQQVQLPYTISMPVGGTGVYTLSTSHSVPGNNATLHIDQYSGAVLTDVRFDDYGLMAKAITLGIALHEGRLFGVANQVIGLITCIGVILLAVSSYVMWRKRKPSGNLGAPNKAKNMRSTVGVLFIMLVAGVIMPLVGLSILVVCILDLLLIRRIQPLKRWFTA